MTYMGMYAGHFDFSQRLVFTVPDLFSAEECAALVAESEGYEWLPATVNSAEGRIVDAHIRNNTTAVLRGSKLGEELYRRVEPHVPAEMSVEVGELGRVSLRRCGVYTPLRIYRYEPGQHFGLHRDQSYSMGQWRSILTLLVYLNDDFRGGQTEFPELRQTILPKTGTALFFQHMLLHAGVAVEQGIKLVLRSDVMYEPLG